MKKTAIGIPIKIVVTPQYEQAIKCIVGTMIVNRKEWESGKEPLLYKIGEHTTSQLFIEIKNDNPIQKNTNVC